MKITQLTLTNIILTSILLTSIFLVSATTSHYETSNAEPEYDPWIDLDDDGDIDLYDAVKLLTRYGAKGDVFPAKAALEYDSEWIDITDKTGQYFNITHNLNSTDIIIDISGKTRLDGGVHRRNLDGTTYLQGWSETYGEIGMEWAQAKSLVQTSDGGYAIVGYIGFPEPQVWLVKTNSVGNMQWNTYLGGWYDSVHSLIQTNDGGYAIAGATSHPEGGCEGYLQKIDPSGNIQWSRTYGDWYEGHTIAYSVIQTGDGGYVLAGYSDCFGASLDFWLIKTDESGYLNWTRIYGGANSDYLTALVETVSGGYCVAGYTLSYGAGSSDFWLAETDSNGNLQWNRTYGGTGEDIARSLVQTCDKGYAIAGTTASFGAGLDDFWLVKTDAYGNMQWNQTYGGTGRDEAWSLVQTRDEGYAIAGTTASFGAGLDDFWLVKTDAYGNMQWNQTYGGTAHEHAYSMVQTSDGGYALGGDTRSFGAGVSCYWIVKTSVESGLVWTDSTADTITLYRGATDAYWNYVRVRIWKIRETP